MKLRTFASLFVAALVVFSLGGNELSAQSPSLTIEVPYEFTAGDTILPAGSYRIQRAKGSLNSLAFQNLETQDIFLIPFLSRVSEKKKAEEAEVVFKKHGGKSYISEIYLTGMEGFHLPGGPAEHDHDSSRP